MPLRVHELKSQLRKAGFEQRPCKGSRTIWTHPDLPGERLTISGNDGTWMDAARKRQFARLSPGCPAEPGRLL